MYIKIISIVLILIGLLLIFYGCGKDDHSYSMGGSNKQKGYTTHSEIPKEVEKTGKNQTQTHIIDKTQFYYDLDIPIVKKGFKLALSNKNNKYLEIVPYVIIQIPETNRYLIFDSGFKNYSQSKINITIEWFNNIKEGDTVHFDYIKKERFFEIKDPDFLEKLN